MARYEPPITKQVAAQQIALALAKAELGTMTSDEVRTELTAMIPFLEADDAPEDAPPRTGYGDTPPPPQGYTPGGPPPAY